VPHSNWPTAPRLRCQNSRRSRPKAANRENGPNREIRASQDSNDATEEAMGYGSDLGRKLKRHIGKNTYSECVDRCRRNRGFVYLRDRIFENLNGERSGFSPSICARLQQIKPKQHSSISTIPAINIVDERVELEKFQAKAGSSRFIQSAASQKRPWSSLTLIRYARSSTNFGKWVLLAL